MECQTLGIPEYFSGKTVYLTGSTGLVGQLILEKLLRTCLDIKRIYVLIRKKKGKRAEERLEELFKDEVYARLKRINPDYREKVSLIVGDNAIENLGMDSEHIQNLIDEVNCVIHCSASVNFVEDLRTIVHTNVRSTVDLIRLARKMKDLQSFVFVSTAFSNCPNEEIREEIYKSPLPAEKLITLVDTFDDEILKNLTPSLLGDWPNTYVYSKCVAESVVEEEGRGLPVAIVRPSIIVSTYKEPLEGWVNNLYGPIGLSISVGMGLVHVMHGRSDYTVDMVPADYVVNNVIAAAWTVGSQKSIKHSDKEERVQVYNCVSSSENPVTWADYTNILLTLTMQMPFKSCYWYPFFFFVSSPILCTICDYFLHLIPAHIGDFILSCVGKRRILVKTYKKITKVGYILNYFTTRQWKFFNGNTLELWNSLSKDDKQMYPFNMSSFTWNEIYRKGTKGVHLYMFKTWTEDWSQAKRKLFLLKVLHYGVVTFLLCSLSALLLSAWKVYIRIVY